MRTKKIQATNDIVEYEKLEFETEQKIEEQETEQEKEKEEQEIEQKNENPTLPGDVEFFITRGVVYILDDYLKLFGKPKKGIGKTSVGILKDEKEENRIIIHDYDYGNDEELLRRAMEPRRSIPFLLIFIVLIGIVFLGWFMFFRGDKENKDQTPQIVQTPIPQEYIDAYNEKQNGLLTSTGENINIQDEIKKQYEIDKLTSQLQMCENEIARLNYTTRENCAVCPITYEKDYNTCIEREKNNEWFIYQGKILEKICKANETSKEFCAKTYYDYFLLSQ